MSQSMPLPLAILTTIVCRSIIGLHRSQAGHPPRQIVVGSHSCTCWLRFGAGGSTIDIAGPTLTEPSGTGEFERSNRS